MASKKIQRLILLAFLFSIAICQAQESQTAKIAQRNLDRYNDFYQPEYAEVILDKDLYFSGEKLWYSLFLTNQAYAVNSLSSIIYVEIRDGYDSVLVRQKVRIKAGVAYGDITLPEDLVTGNYKFAAYSLWMLNGGQKSLSKKMIPIINMDKPVNLSNKVDPAPTPNRALQIQKAGPHSVTINIPEGTKGELLVYNREEVVFSKVIESERSIPLNFENKNDHNIYIDLMDLAGKRVEHHQVLNDNIGAELLLTVNRKEQSPKSPVELSIELKDKEGNPIRGNVSVSVRSKNSIIGGDADLAWTLESDGKLIMGEAPMPMRYKREMFVYPSAQNTLQPMNFSSKRLCFPVTFAKPDAAVEKIIAGNEMRKRIMKAYGVHSFYELENGYNLPNNNSFEPGKYAAIPTLEDFIREVIAQVKVRKIKGQKVLRVRNSDNPSLIYFYKESPMILLDRFIVTADELLNVPVSDIEKIDVIWSIREINSLGIFSLADNGVVSVVTKSRASYSASKNELFKNLHTPLKFSQPQINDKENAVPLLLDPVFWAPANYVNGKSKVIFNTSDDLGDLLIEVKGFTELGYYVSGTTEVKVSARSN